MIGQTESRLLCAGGVTEGVTEGATEGATEGPAEGAALRGYREATAERLLPRGYCSSESAIREAATSQ